MSSDKITVEREIEGAISMIYLALESSPESADMGDYDRQASDSIEDRKLEQMIDQLQLAETLLRYSHPDFSLDEQELQSVQEFLKGYSALQEDDK